MKLDVGILPKVIVFLTHKLGIPFLGIENPVFYISKSSTLYKNL